LQIPKRLTVDTSAYCDCENIGCKVIKLENIMKALLISLLSVLLIASVNCLNNGLGATPPMGWNSWNRFACDINETLIQETANELVSTGLAAAGYIFLNLDDCWQKSR
jgi:alpha-galactosidase